MTLFCKNQIKRRPNWADIELEVLKDEVSRRISILNSRQSSVDTMRKKNCQWEAIAIQVNTVGLHSRTAEECRRKFTLIKSQVKGKIATIRREHNLTGGGQSEAVRLSSFEESAAALLTREQTEGIEDGIDTAIASNKVSILCK